MDDLPVVRGEYMKKDYYEITNKLYYLKLLRHCERMGITFDRWNEIHDPKFRGCANCCNNLYDPSNLDSDVCMRGHNINARILTGGCKNFGVMNSLWKPYKYVGETITVEELALDWWDDLPIQDIISCTNGQSNLVLQYYPEKTDFQDVTTQEIIYMYEMEH